MQNENAIKCFEYVKAQSSDKLKSVISYKKNGRLNYNSSALKQLALELAPDGSYINYSWILSRAAEELYVRDDLEEDEFVRIQNEIV